MDNGPDDAFPFSPSPFLGRAADRPAQPVATDAASVGVNDFYISDEGSRNRSKFRSSSADDAVMPDHLLTLLAQHQTPVHADARKNALRLLSLESFVWGSRGYPPQPRTRPDHTLIWVFAGGLQLDYPRQGQFVDRDSVRFIPAGTAFAAVPQAGAAGFVMLLPRILTIDADPPFPTTDLAGCTGNSGDELLSVIIALASIDEAQDGTSAPDLRQLISQLSKQLKNLQPARVSTRPTPCSNVENRPLVEHFLALASTRLKQGTTIAEFAEELGTTTAALDQACRTASGKRAIELIHQLRLEQAISLLRNGYHSPAQIAKELGYTSLAHFTRAFVEATGRKPDSFRDKS